MEKLLSKNFLALQRQKVNSEFRVMQKKLRDKTYFEKKLKHILQEIKIHEDREIDLVVADRPTKFFCTLAARLGANTKFRRLRPTTRLDRGKVVLHVQEIAYNRSCLVRMREKLMSTRHPPSRRQIAHLTICLVASRTAIEIESVPVVSLNHGCPCCEP